MGQVATRETEPAPGDHPYITRTEGICGGRARIAGSRIPVSTIAELYRQGESLCEIRATYSHIHPAAIDDAIVYYLDHRGEIDAEIEANSLEAVLAETGGVLEDDGVVRFEKRVG